MDIEIGRMVVIVVENKFFLDYLYFLGELEVSKIRIEWRVGLK